MFDLTIEPVDTCGCGEMGYLTTRRLPIDLTFGVGYVDNVPIYHCRSAACREFALPLVVSRRLEEIADHMENTKTTEAVYTWQFPEKQSLDPHQLSYNQNLLQAFTLQFTNRKYADAHVILIVPGQAIFFKSTLDESEYYLLRYDEEVQRDKIWFSFLKFYYEEPELTYEDFLSWANNGHLKELGHITVDEVEFVLLDEFGDWT